MRSLERLMDLTGRVALVTGGMGHIGQAVCSALAEQGASLVIVDRVRTGAGVDEACLRESLGTPSVFFEMDLEERSESAELPEQVKGFFGGLDILVHCAAFVGTSRLEGWNVPFLKQSVDTWRRAVEVNLTAPFELTQRLVPLLAESGRGSVIHFASIYGMLGPDMRLYEGTEMHNAAAYAAGKGGLLQLTRWLATVLAPRIRVNAVTPGGVLRGQPESFHRRYVERTPMGRMAAEEDFKGAVAYLASDLSAYVTGQNLVVDGGWSAW